MSQNLHHSSLVITFVKYLFAGGLGFVLDYGVLTICFEILGWHYLLSAALGFSAGVLFVYASSNKWVFTCRSMKDKKLVEFAIFSLIGIIGLGLTVLFMWVLVEAFGIYPLISKFLTTAAVLLWNFGARKIILYS